MYCVPQQQLVQYLEDVSYSMATETDNDFKLEFIYYLQYIVYLRNDN